MCTITKETNSRNGRFSNMLSVIDEDNLKMVSYNNGAATSFIGIAANNIIAISALRDKQNQLLVKAVNNRTRERNYFRLYSQLVDEEITEEDFDKEIRYNKDDYVVPAGTDASIEDVKAALSVAPSIKGIHSTDDFISLFGITDKSVQRCIECK